MTRDPRTIDDKPGHYGLFEDGELIAVKVDQRCRPSVFDFEQILFGSKEYDVRPVTVEATRW